MVWAKRIVLFVATNILVVLTLSIVLSLLGVPRYLSSAGINYSALLAFCLVWGFGGAFISLALSRIMAKWMMGVQVIDPNTRDPELRGLVDTVYRLARSAGLSTMPQVGFYDSPEVNAFATGPTRSRALVAVSAGLLRNMDRRSVEGVLGHEIAHVANGDMVTMTLVQGVVNAFVMFLARVVAFAISQALRGDRDENNGMSYLAHTMTVWILEMVFMIFGTMVVMWFSRYREYRADQGGSRLAGRDSMIAALRTLKLIQERGYEEQITPAGGQTMQAFKISAGGRKSNFAMLFTSHPPLEERIRRLEKGA